MKATDLDAAIRQMRGMTPIAAQRTAIDAAETLLRGRSGRWPTCVCYAASSLLALALYTVAFAPEEIVRDRGIGGLRERIAVGYALLADGGRQVRRPVVPLPERLHGRLYALRLLPLNGVVGEAARNVVRLLCDVEREQAGLEPTLV